MADWERQDRPDDIENGSAPEHADLSGGERPSMENAEEAPHERRPASASSARTSREPYASQMGAAGVGGEEIHLLDYVRVLHKRRWLAATAFSIVFLSVVVYTFTATPVYEARVRLLIEADSPNVVSFQEVLDETQTLNDYYETQYSLLRSRSLARRTLDARDLWDHPLFGGETASFSVGRTIAAVGGWVGSIFSTGSEDSSVGDLPGNEALGPDGEETVAQSRAIDALLENLFVSPVRNSRIVDLSVRSPNPRLATVVANTHARNYIDQNLEFRFQATQEASDWLSDRLAEQRSQLEQSEAALQQYREQNDAIALVDQQNIVVQELNDLNTAVTQARTERLEKEGLYTQLRALQGDAEALDTFPAILTNAFIQQQKAELAQLQRERAQLAKTLGERHPDMIELASAIELTQGRLETEVAKVVESVRNEYQAALAQEQSLVSALDSQKSEALALNRTGIEYSVLQRDVESNRQIYESLLQRAKETGVSGELRSSNIRIVDQAEMPRSPVSPRRGLNLLLALFGGGIFSVGLVFFFDYLDNRIKTPDEIKTHLGLPFLGMIPKIGEAGSNGNHSPLLNNGVPANFAEAFRNVRTNMLFATAEEGSRSVVVTSTGPGEGKTVVACNLAVGLAQAGQRVLLIDADMRRPRVHEVFGQNADPGLSNLMVGSVKAAEAVKKTPVRGLWMLPAGRIPPNPAELVGSRRFKEFLASLGKHFDWVVVDSPPVMAVTDASLVAHSATGVLFVVGAEMTSRQGAQAATEQLDTARAKFFGAVLNRVDLDRNAYYYSHYYRREYGAYYRQGTTA